MMRWIVPSACLLLFVGCASTPKPPLEPVPSVDLERFMGDWYVLAAIPTRIERDAYNPVESYELVDENTIQTTYTFNEGGFDGPLETLTPRGFVREGTGNAVWGMQFIWPFKADYRIIHLGEDYRTTVIGRQKRDYVWVMARTPSVDDATWEKLERVVADAGYDLAELQEMPQEPVDARTAPGEGE